MSSGAGAPYHPSPPKVSNAPSGSSSSSTQQQGNAGGSSGTPQQSFIAAKGDPVPPQSSWTLDQGVDIPFSGNQAMLAVGPGRIVHEGIQGFGPWAPVLKVTDGPLKGKCFYYGHCGPNKHHVGDTVQAGEHITQIADPTVGISTGPHIEFGQCTEGGNPLGPQTARETENILKNLQANHTIAASDVPGFGGNVSGQNVTSDKGPAAAFSAFIDLPGMMNYATAILARGDKSIYNDEPLLPFIQELSKASFRHFQSLPNGTFYAFFPDQFGSYHHRSPYWYIEDIEIMDGGIQLTDDALATHVFIVGDTNLNNQIDAADILSSKGVVTIFDAFASAFFTEDVWQTQDQSGATNDKQLQARTAAVEFLTRYGVRPFYNDDTTIRNGFFEVFYAYTRFQQLWSTQFATTFQLTFMPELYPGGIVGFPQHGIQCYVESVTHSFDYESGFTTAANFSSPAALGKGDPPVSQGMIRPLSATNQPPAAASGGKSDPKKQKVSSKGIPQLSPGVAQHGHG